MKLDGAELARYVRRMDRARNPSTWIGFAIAALAIVIHGDYFSPAVVKWLTLSSELLGLAGAWFFNAGMRPPQAGNGSASLGASAAETARRAGGALLLLLALGALLLACQLGPRGRTAVATRVTIVAVDGACALYLDDFTAKGASYYDAAIADCKGTGAGFRACIDGKMAPREAAVKACQVYGRARLAVAHGAEHDLGGLVEDAAAALDLAGWKW